MNLLFINPSSMPATEQEALLDRSFILRVPSFSMPIGLLDLSAFVRSSVPSARVELLDVGLDLHKEFHDRERKPQSLASFLEHELDKVQMVPDVVGVSILFSSAHRSSLLMSDLAKRKWPNSTVICGGNHATNCYGLILAHPSVDYVALGEAELSLRLRS